MTYGYTSGQSTAFKGLATAIPRQFLSPPNREFFFEYRIFGINDLRNNIYENKGLKSQNIETERLSTNGQRFGKERAIEVAGRVYILNSYSSICIHLENDQSGLRSVLRTQASNRDFSGAPLYKPTAGVVKSGPPARFLL
jgi:hypothetical protein